MPEIILEKRKLKHGSSELETTFRLIYFTEYVAPKGFLTDDIECHALFYYYLLAHNAYEIERDKVFLEDEPYPDFIYRNIFKSVSTMYAADPYVMNRFWDNVDRQRFALNLPELPNQLKF